MNKPEMKQKMLAALDDIAKGAIALIVTSIVTKIVDDGYDRYIVNRRKTTTVEDPDVG